MKKKMLATYIDWFDDEDYCIEIFSKEDMSCIVEIDTTLSEQEQIDVAEEQIFNQCFDEDDHYGYLQFILEEI